MKMNGADEMETVDGETMSMSGTADTGMMISSETESGEMEMPNVNEDGRTMTTTGSPSRGARWMENDRTRCTNAARMRTDVRKMIRAGETAMTDEKKEAIDIEITVTMDAKTLTAIRRTGVETTTNVAETKSVVGIGTMTIGAGSVAGEKMRMPRGGRSVHLPIALILRRGETKKTREIRVLVPSEA